MPQSTARNEQNITVHDNFSTFLYIKGYLKKKNQCFMH